MVRTLKIRRSVYLCSVLPSPAALGLTYDLRAYNVLFPCQDDYVCFHMWRVTTDKVDDDVVVVTNGNLQSAELEGGTSKCVLQVKDHTDKDYYHVCHRSPGVSPPYSGG